MSVPYKEFVPVMTDETTRISSQEDFLLLLHLLSPPPPPPPPPPTSMAPKSTSVLYLFNSSPPDTPYNLIVYSKLLYLTITRNLS
jgi:hypothetical protein